MDAARPVLLFLVGVVLTAAFFLMGLDHQVGRLFKAGSGGIALAIVPTATPNGCPPTYAVDNRTGRDVFFTLAAPSGGYGPPAPDDSRWNDPSYYRGARGGDPGSFANDADMTDFGSVTPESSEPGIKGTEDSYPDDSNYGGSLSEYGSSAPRPYDEEYYSAHPDNYAYGDRDSFNTAGNGARYAQADNQQPQSRDVFSNGSSATPPPPPAGQPIPLTPGDNSSPFGAPQQPQFDDRRDAFRDGGYGPQQGGFGPPANRVRPGEIFFASAQGEGEPPQGCDGAGNTVTVQLSE
jgi:hypothetical protein